MSSRFPSKQSTQSTGSRGPSEARLSTSSAGSAGRLALVKPKGFTFESMPKSPGSKISPWNGPPDAKCCSICNTETIPSGKGLLICPNCRGLHLKSGRVSHMWALKNSAESDARKETNCAIDNYSMDLGMKDLMNPLASRQAWRRLSVQAEADLRKASSLICIDDAQNDEPQPIFAGIVNTGYSVGDRVKSNVRLPRNSRDNNSNNWDFLHNSVDEGFVIGPGHEAGEIMVKFICSGLACSMKMDRIEHISEKRPLSNIERNGMRRRSSTVF